MVSEFPIDHLAMTRNRKAFQRDASARRVPMRLGLYALIALALLLVIAGPTTNSFAERPKANELVKIVSAKIAPALQPGGTATLKIAAQVIPEWHINSNK